MQPDRATGALVCGHCGTLDEQPVLLRDLEMGALSRLPCPQCAAMLSNAALDGNQLLFCQKCFGMLIVMHNFVPLIEAAQRRENPSGVTPPRRQNPGDRVLNCPGCGHPMISHFYAGPGNLVIDTCERCQMNWLDPGELRRIARAPQGRVWSPPPLETPDPGE